MITLRPLSASDMKPLWYRAYRSESPKWAQLNAPFLDEYHQYTFDEFLVEETQLFLHCEDRNGIFLNEELIGIVSYTLSKKHIQTGIIIYSEDNWGKGIGYNAMKLWHKHIFDSFPNIDLISITTWSGNPGMIALGEKLNMKLIERIDNAHIYKNFYYDRLRYEIGRNPYHGPNTNIHQSD